MGRIYARGGACVRVAEKCVCGMRAGASSPSGIVLSVDLGVIVLLLFFIESRLWWED